MFIESRSAEGPLGGGGPLGSSIDLKNLGPVGVFEYEPVNFRCARGAVGIDTTAGIDVDTGASEGIISGDGVTVEDDTGVDEVKKDVGGWRGVDGTGVCV